MSAGYVEPRIRKLGGWGASPPTYTEAGTGQKVAMQVDCKESCTYSKSGKNLLAPGTK